MLFRELVGVLCGSGASQAPIFEFPFDLASIGPEMEAGRRLSITSSAGLLHSVGRTEGSKGLSLCGDGLLVIGKLLGHRTATMTSRCTHSADQPVKKAAGRISGQIANALAISG